MSHTQVWNEACNHVPKLVPRGIGTELKPQCIATSVGWLHIINVMLQGPPRSLKRQERGHLFSFWVLRKWISFISVTSLATAATGLGWGREENRVTLSALSHALGVLVCLAHRLKTKPALGLGKHFPQAWCAVATRGTWGVAHHGRQCPSGTPWPHFPCAGAWGTLQTLLLSPTHSCCWSHP